MSICHNGQETIILSDSSNTTSPTLLDPAKFQKEIDKGAMGYYLYPLSCDSADTDDENTLEELNLEKEMLSCKTKCEGTMISHFIEALELG